MDNTKEKCRNFLANLLDLSSKEPKSVERSVRNLIQELIDAQVEPEEFCDRLERLLNASPQPCLIGFLKVRWRFCIINLSLYYVSSTEIQSCESSYYINVRLYVPNSPNSSVKTDGSVCHNYNRKVYRCCVSPSSPRSW